MERKGKSRALRIALVSYDVQELRVWHNYLVEQSPEILCSEYRSGEEVLQVLKQRGLVDVVVLGSELEDMDSMEFLTRMSKLRTKPLLLLQDRRYRPEAAVSAARPDGACYLIQQSSLRDMVQTLLVSRGLPTESPAQFCRRMLSEWGVGPAQPRLGKVQEEQRAGQAEADRGKGHHDAPGVGKGAERGSTGRGRMTEGGLTL